MNYLKCIGFRWDIEVFFKYIKNNFKFQHLNEKDQHDNYSKLYLAELIITHLAKIIQLMKTVRLI